MKKHAYSTCFFTCGWPFMYVFSGFKDMQAKSMAYENETPKSKLPLESAASEPASDTDLVAIGKRMQAARLYFDLTQAEFAKQIGGSKPGIQDNESGKNMPGGKVLGGLIRMGINVNWVLTGNGSMLLHQHETAINAPRLTMAVEAVEEGLRSAKRTMPPTAKAELVATVYQALSEDDGPHRLLKLVKDILARSS